MCSIRFPVWTDFRKTINVFWIRTECVFFWFVHEFSEKSIGMRCKYSCLNLTASLFPPIHPATFFSSDLFRTFCFFAFCHSDLRFFFLHGHGRHGQKRNSMWGVVSVSLIRFEHTLESYRSLGGHIVLLCLKHLTTPAHWHTVEPSHKSTEPHFFCNNSLQNFLNHSKQLIKGFLFPWSEFEPAFTNMRECGTACERSQNTTKISRHDLIAATLPSPMLRLGQMQTASELKSLAG